MPFIGLDDVTVKSSEIAEQIRDSNTLPVGSSIVPAIIATVESAIQDPEVKLVEVDLGDGRRWWHTRLFLLVALAEDYTGIESVVFRTTRGSRPSCFAGIAPVASTRRALAAEFPNLQLAYVTTQIWKPLGPNQGVGEAASMTISNYLTNSNEAVSKIEVTEAMLRRWLGLTLIVQGLPWRRDQPDRLDDPQRLWEIVQRSEPFVPLTNGEELLRVVDRQALTRRVAAAALEQSISS
jgi:hypothetical protein